MLVHVVQVDERRTLSRKSRARHIHSHRRLTPPAIFTKTPIRIAVYSFRCKMILTGNIIQELAGRSFILGCAAYSQLPRRPRGRCMMLARVCRNRGYHHSKSQRISRFRMSTETATAATPWVEKYRPRRLEEVSHQTEVVSTLQNAVQTGRLPHLLFFGPPGSGKARFVCDH
jgi:hypothetical protein